MSTPRVHELKCWSAFFGDVNDGAKPFELRKDDRGFEVGDALALREFDPATQQYSGRECLRTISYVLRDAPGFGLMPGFVILGLEEPIDEGAVGPRDPGPEEFE